MNSVQRAYGMGFMRKMAESGVPFERAAAVLSKMAQLPPPANPPVPAGKANAPVPGNVTGMPPAAPGTPGAAQPPAGVNTVSRVSAPVQPQARPQPQPQPKAQPRPYEDKYDKVSPESQAMIRGLWAEQDQYARQMEAENAKKLQQEQFRTDFSGMDAAGQYDALMKMPPEQRREYAKTLSPYRQQQIRAVQAQRSGQQAQPGQIGGWSKADQWASTPAKEKYRILQNASPEQRALLRKYTSQNDYDEVMRLHRQKKYNDALDRGDFDTARSITW